MKFHIVRLLTYLFLATISILYIMELRVSSKNDISDRPFLHVIVTKFAKLNVDTTRNTKKLIKDTGAIK